jgi:hypothetical protein
VTDCDGRFFYSDIYHQIAENGLGRGEVVVVERGVWDYVAIIQRVRLTNCAQF